MLTYSGLDPSIDTTPMFGGPLPMGAVYMVHCRTWKLAQKLAGLPGGNCCLRLDLEATIADPEAAPALFSFRALPKYRSKAAKQLRAGVAAEIRRFRSCNQ